MLCDICNKKKAKIYYTEIINGEKREQHLCEDCAASYGGFPGVDKKFAGLTQGLILSGILGNYAKGLKEQKEKENVCPNCGMTEHEFLAKARFGCASCYETFASVLGNNLRVMQGADMHFGKRPVDAEGASNYKKFAHITEELEAEQTAPSAEEPAKEKKTSDKKSKTTKKKEKESPADRERELRIRLNEAVAVEDYEKAAKLRDEIRSLKK